jgi:DNA polymerase III subunit beta
MELTIQKQPLLDGLQMVQGIVEKKSSMPILSNVLLETVEEGVHIVATDLQIGLRLTCPARIKQPGGITVLARKFFEIIRELPDGDIYLRLNENNRLFISCKDIQYQLVGLPLLDFPALPETEQNQLISLEGALIREMIQKTIFSISIEDTRYNLSGIYFEHLDQEGQKILRMVATDGHRLSLMDKEIGDFNEEVFPKGVLLPRKAVSELLKILDKPGPIQFGFKDNNGLIIKDQILFIMRLLDRKFPDYNLVLPKKRDKMMSLPKNDFLDAMRRMAVLSTDKYKGVKIILTKGKMEIQSINPEIGEAKESLLLEYKEEKIDIGFNPRYFIDALQVMKSEKVIMELNDGVSPAILKGEEDPGYVALIMPMKIFDETGL